MSLHRQAKVLLASNNQGKLTELMKMLQPLGVDVVSVSQVQNLAKLPAPKETAKTFQDNALLKAKYYGQFWSGPVIADDSGLEVVAWQNLPGINSSRWLVGSDHDRNLGLLAKLETLGAIAPHQRQARFVSVICWLESANSEPKFFRGEVDGEISNQPRGSRGFGYEPIFIPAGFNQTFAEMALEAKNHISHRGKAMAQLVEYLSELN